jgi:hypothetical protein
MKESLSSIDNRVIFRETFNSFDDISKNGGTPTNITLNNGVLISQSLSTSRILYPFNTRGVCSIRFVFKKVTTVAGGTGAFIGALFDARENSGAGQIYIYDDNTISRDSGNIYIDNSGVNTGGSVPFTSSMKQLVITDFTINCSRIYLLNYFGGGNYSWGTELELVEIYKGNLTATEVSELYKGTLYKEPNSAKDYTFNCNFINGYINETTGAVMTNTGNTITKDGGVNSLRPTTTSTLYSNKVISSIMSNSLGTISVWCKPTGTPVTKVYSYDGQTAVCDNTGLTGGYLGIMRAVIGGLDRIWVYNYDGNEDKVGIPYTTGEWVNIVWIHSGGQLYGYKNGVLIGSTASGNTQQVIYLFSIGQRFSVSAANWSGRIGEVKVWNRALTQTEITRLYNSQKGLYI